MHIPWLIAGPAPPPPPPTPITPLAEGLEGERTTGAKALLCLTAVIMLAGEKERGPEAEPWLPPAAVLVGWWGVGRGGEAGMMDTGAKGCGIYMNRQGKGVW